MGPSDRGGVVTESIHLFPCPHFVSVVKFCWNKNSSSWINTHFCPCFSHRKSFPQKKKKSFLCIFFQSQSASSCPSSPRDLQISFSFLMLLSLPATLFLLLTKYFSFFEVLPRLEVGLHRRIATSQRERGQESHKGSQFGRI